MLLAWRARRKHEVLAAHLDAWLPVHSGGWAVFPFCQGDSGVTKHGCGARSRSAQVQRDDSYTDGRRSAVRDERQPGLDSGSLGHSTHSRDGGSGKGSGIANLRIHNDSRTLRDSRNGGTQFQGDQNMDQVISFLALSSGYIIAFAVGAWIGRPLLELLSNRILRK